MERGHLVRFRSSESAERTPHISPKLPFSVRLPFIASLLNGGGQDVRAPTFSIFKIIMSDYLFQKMLFRRFNQFVIAFVRKFFARINARRIDMFSVNRIRFRPQMREQMMTFSDISFVS